MATKQFIIFFYFGDKQLQYITFTIHYNKFYSLVPKFYLTLKTGNCYRLQKRKVRNKNKKKDKIHKKV